MVVFDLATLANLAEILAAGTVVGGVVFALAQLRAFREQRNAAAAHEVLERIHSPTYMNAQLIVLDLPEGLSGEEIRDRGKSVEEAINLVGFTFEGLGTLIYHRVVPIAIVDDLIGGFIVASWRRTKPYVLLRRRELAQPSYQEWVQWLAERLEERQRGGKTTGVYETRRSWTE